MICRERRVNLLAFINKSKDINFHVIMAIPKRTETPIN